MNSFLYLLIKDRVFVGSLVSSAIQWSLALIYACASYAGGIPWPPGRVLCLLLGAASLSSLAAFLLRKHPAAQLLFDLSELCALSILLALSLGAPIGMEYVLSALIPLAFLCASQGIVSKRTCTACCAACFCVLCALVLMRYLGGERAAAVSARFWSARILCSLAGAATMIYGCVTMTFLLFRSHNKTARRTRAIAYEANHDPLTGLMNRRRTYELLASLQEKKSTQGIDFAVAILDIDNFKRFNEDFGHKCGDFALKEFTSMLRILLPQKMVKLGRWGGEEFIIVYRYYDNKIPYELDAIRRKACLVPLEFRGQKIEVTATFGISSSRLISGYENVIADADKNLLEGKRRGKNRIKVSPNF